MDMWLILTVTKSQESFGLTVGIFLGFDFLLGIYSDVLYYSPGGLLARLVLAYSEILCWC